MKRTVEDRVDVDLMKSGIGDRSLAVYALAAAAVVRGQSIAECGVAEGRTAEMLRRLVVKGAGDATLHLFDVFDSCKLTARNQMAADAVQAAHATPMNDVVARVGSEGVVYHPGLFQDTLPRFDSPLGFIHADGDLYDSTVDVIRMAHRLVVHGGAVVFDDYGTEWSGVAAAVDLLLQPDWVTYLVAGSGQLVAVRT